MRHISRALITIQFALALLNASHANELVPYPAFYENSALFDKAIVAEDGLAANEQRPTGLIVPHHLLVAPLIARGFKLASAHSYKRAILLFPDHFRQARSVFATTERSFETVSGRVSVDRQAVSALLKPDQLVERSDLFDKEHGIRAILPFLKHYMPKTRIVPIAVATRATKADADRLAERLLPLVDDDTVIIQSTDFSHFLPFDKARQSDQQTLNVLASGDLEQIARLKMPDHVDSVMALYVHALLQAKLGSEIQVVSSRNSNEYFDSYLEETTSYLTAVYGRFQNTTGHPVPEEVETVYFAGDFTLARNNLKLGRHEVSAAAVTKEIRNLTRGKPLYVNLEGVILPNVPKTLREDSFAMPEPMARTWFEALNIKLANLANNHTGDFGALGLTLTKEALLTGKDLDVLYEYQGAKPIVAFLHWGEEFEPEPDERIQQLVDELRRRGVSLVIGAHPHVRSGAPVSVAGGDALMVYSLGNFLFDQSSAISSGAVAEVRFFPQGTHFTRLIEIPNYYEFGLKAARN
jgi:poly-gamma-glutamate synthesis protein (capsule biosynthesis protein)